MEKSFVYSTKSLYETELLGKALGKALLDIASPFLILLKGPLGSGKTTLIKTIIAKLVSINPESISSPTFQYASLYTAKNGVHVAHFDLWRLDSPSTFVHLGLDELMESTIGFMEWPEKIASLHPKANMTISIEAPSEHERKFTISTPEEPPLKHALEALV